MFELIDNSPEPVALASLSCLEVALLPRRGRIAIPMPIDEFFIKAIDESGLVLLPLTRIAARAAYLPNVHRDPIDRVIIATAQEHDADLVTRDGLIARYPDVRVRWTT